MPVATAGCLMPGVTSVCLMPGVTSAFSVCLVSGVTGFCFCYVGCDVFQFVLYLVCFLFMSGIRIFCLPYV